MEEPDVFVNKDFLKHFTIKFTVKSFSKIVRCLDSATVIFTRSFT